MTPPSQNEVTQLLLAWSDGDKAALEELTPLVYAELRRLAERRMRRSRSDQADQVCHRDTAATETEKKSGAAVPPSLPLFLSVSLCLCVSVAKP